MNAFVDWNFLIIFSRFSQYIFQNFIEIRPYVLRYNFKYSIWHLTINKMMKALKFVRMHNAKDSKSVVSLHFSLMRINCDDDENKIFTFRSRVLYDTWYFIWEQTLIDVAYVEYKFVISLIYCFKYCSKHISYANKKTWGNMSQWFLQVQPAPCMIACTILSNDLLTSMILLLSMSRY